MIVGELDEISYDMEVDGELVRRQLARRIWERRGWATVMVLFEERKGGTWQPAKLALYRMRHLGEVWKQHAVVTLPGGVAAELAAELQLHALGGGGGDDD